MGLYGRLYLRQTHIQRVQNVVGLSLRYLEVKEEKYASFKAVRFPFVTEFWMFALSPVFYVRLSYRLLVISRV
jgi:hypothetical protein